MTTLRLSDLVATALLGTARRSVPAWATEASDRRSPDPPQLLLGLAACSRVAAALQLRRAIGSEAAPVPTAATANRCPEKQLSSAPPAALRLLTELLVRADIGVLNYWLEVCGSRGLGVPPVTWTPLARLAVRSRTLELPLLLAALGPQGRWFLTQNPEWARLAGYPGSESGPDRPQAAAAGRTEQTAVAGPASGLQSLLARPDPWPSDVVEPALLMLATEELAPDQRHRFADELGRRLPVSGYAALSRAVDSVVRGPRQLSWSRTVTAGAVLAEVERALWSRVEVDLAFDPGLHVDRISFPEREESAARRREPGP
jgi:hypothetical protein